MLKNEPSFEQDKCSVSWHADSTLEHFSSIGVYHSTSAVAAPSTSVRPSAPNVKAAPATEQAVHAGAAPTEDVQDAAETATAEEEVREGEGEDLSWKVALRVWYDAEGPNATKAISSRAAEMQNGARIAPSVAVPLPSGSCYFLLDDFNHHHQHAGMYDYATTI